LINGRRKEEMTRNIRYVCYGLGVMGTKTAIALQDKVGIECVGAIDANPDLIGMDMGEVIGAKKNGIKISSDVSSVLSMTKPDIAIHMTSSRIAIVKEQLSGILRHGVNVVSSCEELLYPFFSSPEEAKDLDRIAKDNGVTILGTGINPGFLMDTLPIVLTGACLRVDSIEVTRVMDATKRRGPFQKKIGAGLTIKQFEEFIRGAGHVGLEESISLVSNALGWKLDDIVVEQVEPVLSQELIVTPHVEVDKGNVAGVKQVAFGVRNGKKLIILNFQAYLGAPEEYDSISIVGEPNINEIISPCVNGDVGTVAMIINSIPKVIDAPPGLVTMKDLPIISAFPC
jgi:2,4-diaminopentanoate dehydrogenase